VTPPRRPVGSPGRAPHGRPLAALAGAALFISMGLSRPAAAAPPVTVEVQGGMAALDSHLADYGWKADPRPTWGVMALSGGGPWRAGLRLRGWRTDQSMDGSGGETVAVKGVAVEAVGQVRLARPLGIGVSPTASVGRLHLGYRPDRVSVDLGAGIAPLTVALAPITTWTASAGLALDRRLVSRLGGALAVEREWFALDTAHRSGAGIVETREEFAAWRVHAGLSWEWGR
jgi:hypothetical protein